MADDNIKIDYSLMDEYISQIDSKHKDDVTSNTFYQYDENGDAYLTDAAMYLNQETKDFNVNLDTEYTNYNIDYTRGIWGCPYQFLPSTDMRTDGNVDNQSMDGFGIEYAERIVTRMPLLLLTPGKPFFMNGRDKSLQKLLMGALSGSSLDSTVKGAIGDIISGKKTGGKYYTLRFAFDEYYQYVNTTARTMARVLGISNMSMKEFGVEDTPIGNYDWSNYTNEKIKGAYSSKEFVAFYVDSETSISDNFSNTTSESMLASAANQVSDIGREIGFLLGTEGSRIDGLLGGAKETLTSGLEGIDEMISGIPVLGNLLQDISAKLVTVMTGGKLLFPEIWADSSFTRQYSISLKLRTPEPDILSWYINIGVPICHLLAFVLPMQTSGATNQGYKSPYLVRGFYKGLFNCDMGIITDMQMNRGNESSWTLDGLPMEVDVSMTIKELYSAMSMTNNDGLNNTTIMDNDALLNYIMNICGINIAQPSIEKYINLYKDSYTNKITNIPSNILNAVQNNISQWMYDINHLGT